MNREDAIKELKILLKYAKRVDEIMGGGTEQSDTLDFAIKSLQMPIIAFACDGRKCGGDCSGCGRTTDIEHAKNFTKVIDTYFEILQTEPSKNAYERGKAEALEWIPCDEKLPSESGRYLVSYVLLNDEICTGIAHYGKPLLPLNTNETECGWYKTDGDGDFYVDDILAWKPLPKPYCPQNDTDIGTAEQIDLKGNGTTFVVPDFSESDRFKEKPMPNDLLSHEEAWADCDLISRADLIVQLEEWKKNPNNDDSSVDMVNHFIGIIKAQPSAERVPSPTEEYPLRLTEECAIELLRMTGWLQAHDKELSAERVGEWIETAEQYAEQYYVAINEKGGGVDENTPYFLDEDIACSECFAIFNAFDNETDRFNYCPNCGAKMKGDGND